MGTYLLNKVRVKKYPYFGHVSKRFPLHLRILVTTLAAHEYFLSPPCLLVHLPWKLNSDPSILRCFLLPDYYSWERHTSKCSANLMQNLFAIDLLHLLCKQKGGGQDLPRIWKCNIIVLFYFILKKKTICILYLKILKEYTSMKKRRKMEIYKYRIKKYSNSHK